MAAPQDAADTLKIYAQYMDTAITFEYELPSEHAFAERIGGTLVTYPYIVCEEDGRIVAYAYAHKYQERRAYQWNAELSVYNDMNFRAKGIGTKLYSVLIEILQLQGVKNVYGIVTAPNEASRRLHLHMGFQILGTYHNTGWKCGEWHDVRLFEKQIGPHELDPQPIISIKNIPADEIQAIFDKYSG